MGKPSLLLCASLVTACSDDVYVGSDLLWSAHHESADLSEWSLDGSGSSEVEAGRGSITVSDAFAHDGRYSVKLEKVAGGSADGAGPRLMRYGTLPARAFYSAWFLVPEDYVTTSYWTILQFDSHTSTSPVDDRGVNLQLRSLPDANGLVLQVFFHDGAYLGAPLSNPAPLITPGSWFQLEVEFNAATDTSGMLVVWLDGRRVYDISGRPTVNPASLEFMLASMLVDASPSPVVLYVDDVSIARSRAPE
ncbi:MAG: hypothetical protein QM756_13355 [Polyangiaceae bacterium]